MSIDVLVGLDVLTRGNEGLEKVKSVLEKGIRVWVTPITKFLLYKENASSSLISFVDSLPEVPLKSLKYQDVKGSSKDPILGIEKEIARSFNIDRVLSYKKVDDDFVISPDDFLKSLVEERHLFSKVPLVDLRPQLWETSNEILDGFSEIFATSYYVQGKFVKSFEDEFAHFVGSTHAIAVNSGTSALILALMALGVKEGDEIITSPFTFIATAEAISFVGAKPVFVDIEPDSYTIDPEKIKGAITTRTKGIIPVHLYGQPANMEPILEIAREHGLFVLEDACQAHGSRYKTSEGWVNSGNIGDAAAFSFYPGKNLGAFGEGGAITTSDDELAQRMRSMRDHGSISKYEHKYIGLNLRLENFQGVVLNAKIKNLPRWNEERRKISVFYNTYLEDLPLDLPREKEYAYHVYHLYVVKTDKRDELMKYLAEKGVFCGIHYPKPLHLQEAYSFLGHGEGSFPVAEDAARKVLSLPIFQGMRLDEARKVVNAIRSYYGREEI